jgi:hypothetical protein
VDSENYQPTLGWRRIALVVGPLSGLSWLASYGIEGVQRRGRSLGWLGWLASHEIEGIDRGTSVVAVAAALALGIAVLTLVGRDLAEWVRQGFKEGR